MIAGSVAVNLTASTADFEKNMKRAASSHESFIKTIKQGLGEESTFGGFAKILAGTGAVAGLSLAGRILDDSAHKAAELQQQLHTGALSAGEVAEKLLTTIPIYGSIIEAGRTWSGILDGTAQHIATMEAAARNTDAVTASMKANTEQVSKFLADSAKSMTALRQERERIATGGTGTAADLLGISQEQENRKSDLADKVEQEVKAVKERRDRLVADLQRQMVNINPSARDGLRGLLDKTIIGAPAPDGTQLSKDAYDQVQRIKGQIEQARAQADKAIASIQSRAPDIGQAIDTNAVAKRVAVQQAAMVQAEVDMMDDIIGELTRKAEELKKYDEDIAADVESAMKQTGDMLKTFDEMDKAGQSTFDATRTPAERYAKQLEDLQEQLKQGAIDQETFNRAAAQAKDLMNGGGRGGVFESIDKANIDVAGLQDVNNDKSIQYQRDMAAYLKNIDDYLKAGALGQIS